MHRKEKEPSAKGWLYAAMSAAGCGIQPFTALAGTASVDGGLTRGNLQSSRECEASVRGGLACIVASRWQSGCCNNHDKPNRRQPHGEPNRAAAGFVHGE